MFDKDELDVFVKHGKMTEQVAQILAEVEEEEPDLMGYWVYRKRIRRAPDDVQMKATERMAELCEAAGLRFGVRHHHVFENVCNAIWDRLPEDERQRLMRSI